jgi:predicted negative regulator of RcsB-dependent stress response
MTENKPAPNAVEKEKLKEHEDLQVLHFLKEYGMPLVLGVSVALLAYLGFVTYKNHQAGIRRRAAQNLMQAQSAEQLQAIVDQYPNTPSAPIAMLTLAANYLHGGQYPMARNQYARFEREHADHMLKPAAVLGQAYCVEAEGNPEGALASYQKFQDEYAGHFLLPQAIFGQARCLEQLGRFEEAKTVYEEYLEANPESRWAPQAESSLLYVDKTQRAVAAQ